MSFRRSLLLGLLLYGLIIAGLGLLDGTVIAIAFPLVGYLMAVLLTHPGPLSLEVRRTVSDAYVKLEDEVKITLAVTNTGSQDLDELSIADTVPPGLTVADGESSTVRSLRAGETCTQSYTVTGKRGTYRFPGTQIQVYEHMGLFSRRRYYTHVSRLAILPGVPAMRRIPIRPLRTRGFAGPIASRQAGSGTDFFGVRTYEPGDPQRWINWRLSARHTREIFVNQYERERIADVGLILDARERNNVMANGDSLFECAVEATAALADMFLADGNRVGLLIYGRGLERTFPGYGKRQRERILQALAGARVGGSMVFDNLDYLPTRFYPAKSQIVLVSPLCEADPPVLSRLRARGYEVLVVSPDPIDFEKRAIPQTETGKMAVRIARAERNLWT
ncbi:MAG: DUF58 domain-containing protein, partial [Anaerolineae bacterium]|nr:DUF58 domain-containing protein [Anaerolineae bacterium]